MSNTPERPTGGELTPLQKAFLTIRTLRQELDAAQAGRTEPIAIVGMGCRVPGADGPDAFWELLSEGRDAITEVPRSRWNVDALYDPTPGAPGKVYSREGGYIEHVDTFDAAFFGITAREAATMDPQQRLLLEVAWEAIEHAGIAPASLKGTPTGVFVGVTSADYACLQLEQNHLPDDPYFSSGAALNACAGRVSYVLGLQGPCMAVDTACSSSLTAIHLACSALRNRECDAALAGGVNLMLATWPHVTLAAAQMVAPDGRCKTFDASADGYVRGEGCGIVVLKRLSDAQKVGDRVLAVIRGTAVNQDGASSGFTVPNGVAQQTLIRRTLASAGIGADEIDYVESHGTGTALGDPIEAGALGAVLGQAPGRTQPLLLGSVKSNIGHLESAAGVAGLIKLVLALGHGRIPRTLHVTQPNPKIDWSGLNLRLVRESLDWQRGTTRRCAALSAFGVSGSNAHLILEEAPAAAMTRPEQDRTVHVLALSAKVPGALTELAAAYRDWLAGRADIELADICSTANRGRNHFKHRAAVCGSTVADLREALSALSEDREAPGLFRAADIANAPARSAEALRQIVNRAVAETRATAPDWPTVMADLAEAYAHGADVDWTALDAGIARHRVQLPTYRFQRKRYWITEKDETPMTAGSSNATTPGPEAPQRHRDEVRSGVIALVAEMLRERPDDLPLDVPFLEMGADSLILVHAARRLDEQFGVKVEIRQFFEEIVSVSALADYIADRMPEPRGAQGAQRAPSAPSAPVVPVLPMSDGSRSELAQIVQAQMELMTRQLELLAQVSGASQPQRAVPPQAVVKARAAVPAGPAPSRSSPLNDLRQGISAKPSGLTGQQQRSLDDFIRRFTKRTQRSKALAEAARPQLADSRATVGFRFSTKEILYPITGSEALGSRLTDVDGNSYVDLTMGFGALLFGSKPDFACRAIAGELERGIQLGMRSDLMEEVSRLFCELTGQQRVVFTNSGTEAVMTALRLARAATGRTKIVLFEGSYHGHSDGTLAQRSINPALHEAEPVAPGIPPNVARDVVVLEYGTPQALETIRGIAHEVAAVVVEPVQSRRLEFQPVEFLRELRVLTEVSGTALVFDEMITGFRAHPAGCQGLFGIDADLATYGKIIGGGMPIGAVAGKAKFLDGIDGGRWQYGDQSYPATARTYFGGTFCQHPLAMAASLSVLRHLKAQGPALQEMLNQRTAALAATLNEFFASEDLAFRVSHFSSIFRFEFSGNLELFFYHMLEKGVYIWEWRNCFLSTAHTDEDLDRVVGAVKATIADLRADGFLPPRDGSSPPPAPSAAPAQAHTAASGFRDRGTSKLRQREWSVAPAAPFSYSMSEAQKQLWLLAKMSEDGARAYNEPAVLTIEGDLDLDAFSHALTQVVARHESLRTTVDPAADRLVVHPASPVAPTVTDLTGSANPDQDVLAHLDHVTCTLCDFVNGPVFSATLLKVAAQRHVLVLGLHHLLIDGLSMVNVIGEINACYAAKRSGSTASLPAPMQYREFVSWHEAHAASPAMQAHEAYWLARLATEPSPGDIPTDRPRPVVRTFHGAVRHLTIDAALMTRATQQAGVRGYTPFMLLLAVYQLLLHRLSGQDTIVVGCPSAGRAPERSDTLVGYCAHLLPVVSTVPASGRLTVSEHLRQVRGTVLDAFQHQDYPFARLLNAMNLKRDVSRPPLVSALFNLERPSLPSVDGGLALSPFPRHGTFARMDLTLTANVYDTGVVLECDYNTDLFDAATIDRLLRQYETLLAGVVDHPDADVHALPLLDEAMRQRQLVAWNDSEAQAVDRCAHHLFESRVEQGPDSVAVSDRAPAGRQMTYRDLNAQANQVARFLRQSGVGPEQRVAVYLRRSADLLVALMGSLKAGAAYVPIDPSYPIARIEQIIGDAGVSMLLTQEDLLASLPAPPDAVCCLDCDRHLLERESTDNLAITISLDSPAYVIYTSGSTGPPKGVVVLHRGLTNYLLWAAKAYEADGGTPVLGSVGFDATVTSLFVPLVAGGFAELLPEGEELPALAAALSGHAAYRFIKITPAHLDAVNRLLPDGPNPAAARRIVLGGEAIAPTALVNWTRHASVRIVNEYGPTEAVVGCCTYEFGGPPGDTIPIGRPISGAQLYVLDDQLEPTPIGVAGELYIGGAGVARGYLGRADLTAASFVPDPFAERGGIGHPGDRLYKTGDRARYRADGQLEYLGRLDGQVKLRGYRLELAEIESVLLQQPDVREAAVLLREDHPGHARLVAYLRVSEGGTLSISKLRDDLRRRLPDYMVPSAFVRLDAMPLTTNGKIDRSALPAPDRERPEQAAEFVSPRGATEDALAAIWREVLNLDQVGAYDNFFDLGGTSLLALDAFKRIELFASGRGQVLDLFRYPTIRSLALYLGDGDAAAPAGDDEIRQRAQRQKHSARKQASRRARETSPQV